MKSYNTTLKRETVNRQGETITSIINVKIKAPTWRNARDIAVKTFKPFDFVSATHDNWTTEDESPH